jgi:hypothetical protein
MGFIAMVCCCFVEGETVATFVVVNGLVLGVVGEENPDMKRDRWTEGERWGV